jgi:hypothetical protein
MSEVFESLSRWNTSEDFGLQVARGQVRGHRIIHIFGFNPDIDSGVEETVWTFGGIYTHLSAPSKLKVASGNANDSGTGTGARTVQVVGINGTGAEISETVTLNGQTAVETVHEYTEVNGLTVMSVGSGGRNAGQIYAGTGTVTSGVPQNVIGHIAVGDNNSQTGHYTIPKGFTGYLTHGNISTGTTTNGYVIGKLKLRLPNDIIITAATVTFFSGEVDYDFKYPVRVPEGACVFANALTTKNDESVSCYFEILLIRNPE